jgi:hypothetical protein
MILVVGFCLSGEPLTGLTWSRPWESVTRLHMFRVLLRSTVLMVVFIALMAGAAA